MAGSAEGALKAAARRVGLSAAEYVQRLEQNEKWCGGCREWQSRAAFGQDSSRADGLASVCLASRAAPPRGPSRAERRMRAAQGQVWCRGCKDWLPERAVRKGVCSPHRNEEGRARYARLPELRARVKARNRKLDVVPEWWREQQFAEFGGLCAYGCGRAASALDHVEPVAGGGESTPSNLVPACKPCNSSKCDRDPAPWIDRGYLAFPDQWEHLVALSYEHGRALEAC